jgi:DNA helicase II / ATP-dependent DNA helicase PcrA
MPHGILRNIMEKATFETAYARLNPAQKEAVDTIEGPVMVIAGPGTGKTQILTLRIANILLRTDTAPENILALTFTESGARAMRERLHSYIGNRAYRVHIHTFHEFAGSLINMYPDSYDRAVGGRPATDLEKVGILEDIIETGKVRSLRPHGNHTFYIKPIMSAIALMKREYITPDTFVEIIKKQEDILRETPQFHEKGAHKGKVRGEYQKLEKELTKNRELLFVYRAYDAALTTQNLYDFEDMIYETVRALTQNEDMLRDLQERFQYVLADEHQDVNGSQNKILELLASFHDRPNLFVVGDEKQAIFRFQGASLENFLYFEEKFPHTKTIALRENYRSVQKILDVSHELITAVDSPAAELRVPLTAETDEVGSVQKSIFSHEAVEDEGVVSEISGLIAAGVPKEEIAIIVRSNREVETFALLLRAKGIPANATADGDILYHPITTHVRLLLSAVLEVGNEEALFSVLHAPYWGITRTDLVHVLRERSYARPLASIIEDSEFLGTLPLSDTESILKVARTLGDARNRMVTEAPHRVLEYILTASGFINHILKEDPLEGGRVVRRLYDEIESLVRTHETSTLTDVLRMFTTRVTHSLPLNAPYIHTNTDAVQVMTAHKSKGLEFEHVFVPHLTDSRWGDTSKPTYFKIPITKQVNQDEFDALDDERKLLYVAMTRAKRGLHLSSSKQNVEGRPFSETPLLDEIGEAHITVLSTEDSEAAFNPLQALEHTEDAAPVDVMFLQTTLRDRGISATSLNNYLRSPWNYLYRNVLRVPEVQAESAQFGTALHNTLRKVTQYRSVNNTLPTTTLIKTYFEHELGRLPLTVHEYTRLHERGLEALTAYLDTVGPRLPMGTKEEVKFEAVLETGDETFPHVRLTGNLDRLDYDTQGNLIGIVDYKSGKPKTRGYIEGTTKDSTGDYKRQLTFYALLLSLQDDTRYHTKNGTLSFVESDEKGKIHEESYTITDEEVEALRLEILRVVREIAHGAFLNAPCDSDTSDYCHLVSMLKKNP